MKRMRMVIVGAISAIGMMCCITGVNANALVNTYSTFAPAVEGSNVSFGAYATKRVNYRTDFVLTASLYNNANGSYIGSTTGDIKIDAVKDRQYTLEAVYPKSNCVSVTKIDVKVRAYTAYSTYATPYETFANSVYYYLS